MGAWPVSLMFVRAFNFLKFLAELILGRERAMKARLYRRRRRRHLNGGCRLTSCLIRAS